MKIKKTDSCFNLCFRLEGQKKYFYKFFSTYAALISFLNKLKKDDLAVVYYTLSQTINFKILEDTL